MADSDPIAFIEHLLHIRHGLVAVHPLRGGGEGRCYWLVIAMLSQFEIERVFQCVFPQKQTLRQGFDC